MIFLDMLKGRSFKEAIGASSIKVDHNRKNPDYAHLREFGFKLTKRTGRFIFLVGLYQPQFTVSDLGYGVLNFNAMDDELDEGKLVKRDLVRQIKVSTGLNEGYLLYSYEPNYKSYGDVVKFLRNLLSSPSMS